MAKSFFKDGKWVDDPRATVVSLCRCGNKYIKTRAGQARCLRCVAAAAREARHTAS